MSGLQNRNKTLGEAMTELRSRLGYATTGSASKGNSAILKSFLQEAHEYVFGELVPTDRNMFTTIRMHVGQVLYDWHDDDLDADIDPGYVKALTIVVSANDRFGMTQGISQGERAFSQIRQYPAKYDTTDGQLEVWPAPDQEYDLIVEHTAMMGRFEQAPDRPSVPYRLVFLYALAQAKAHYRHPDATGAATTFNNMMSKAKSRNKENRRWIVPTGRPADMAPQVVKTANGYQLKV